MRKLLLLVAILLAGPLAISQNAKQIIGKWVFADILEKEKLDAQSIELTTKFFKDFTLNFREDGTTTLVMLKKAEDGSYEFDKTDDKKLNVTSKNGKVNTLTIVKLDDKQLAISMGDAGAFLMNKVSDIPDAIVIKAAAPKVAATAKQLIAKWNVVDMEKEKKSELFYELIKGSYIEFFKDNTYHTKILSFEENGVWELAQDNTIVEVETADDKGFWNILHISDTDLTMQRGTEGKKYFFKKATE
jgi:hypothetical protein